MKVLLAHPGTQYSFQLATQLYKRDMLHEFHTGLAFGKDSWVYKLFSKFPGTIFNKISNRFIEEVPDRFLRRYPGMEIMALIKLKLGYDEEKVLYKRNRQFQLAIPDLSIQQADVIIGFDTSSWILAEKCRKINGCFILDVSIAHPVSKDKVYRQIIRSYPDWKFSVKQKSHKHITVEETEMKLASHIVVASSFTLNTYVEHGISAEKISVNAYGVDGSSFTPDKSKEAKEKVRFVFVGLVDARKGIPFLLEIWHSISILNAEITLIGPITSNIQRFIAEHFPSVIIKGKLPFNEIKNTLPSYDVMIFPSFFEGFGLVILEAMASGLPVITTTATCGPDVINNGTEGFVIEPGDAEGLKRAIEYFLNDIGAVSQMGGAARDKALQFSWDAYGRKWVEIINSLHERKYVNQA